MSEIAEKLADALSMFWQSLDEQERRLLLLGACYLVALAASVPLERRRRIRERELVADAVARHLAGASRA